MCCRYQYCGVARTRSTPTCSRPLVVASNHVRLTGEHYRKPKGKIARTCDPYSHRVNLRHSRYVYERMTREIVNRALPRPNDVETDLNSRVFTIYLAYSRSCNFRFAESDPSAFQPVAMTRRLGGGRLCGNDANPRECRNFRGKILIGFQKVLKTSRSGRFRRQSRRLRGSRWNGTEKNQFWNRNPLIISEAEPNLNRYLNI